MDVSLTVLQAIISKYGFFTSIEDSNGEVFFSPLLNELMAPYLTKVEQNRIAGKISAERKKLKYNKQLNDLRQLSQKDSSQQVLYTCTSNVEQKKEEKTIENKNRKENRKSLLINNNTFRTFKINLIKEFAGELKIKFPYPNELNFLENTIVELKLNGYLHNTTMNKDLTIEQAQKVWNYIFEHRIHIMETLNGRA